MDEPPYDSIEIRRSRLKQWRQKRFIVTKRKRIITSFIGMGKVGKPKGTDVGASESNR